MEGPVANIAKPHVCISVFSSFSFSSVEILCCFGQELVTPEMDCIVQQPLELARQNMQVASLCLKGVLRLRPWSLLPAIPNSQLQSTAAEHTLQLTIDRSCLSWMLARWQDGTNSALQTAAQNAGQKASWRLYCDDGPVFPSKTSLAGDSTVITAETLFGTPTQQCYEHFVPPAPAYDTNDLDTSTEAEHALAVKDMFSRADAVCSP